jgi:AcrR family transcriptional regulator
MPTSTAPDDAASARRGRGRPPRSPAETEAVRAQIRQAAARVMAEHGYHGVSVELILRAAGMSRATFYRHFANTDEVIDLILRDANDRLVQQVVGAVHAADGPQQKVEAGLLAWRHWCEEAGPLLRTLYAEMHDTQSLAYAHRLRAIDVMKAEFNNAITHLGRPPLDPLQVETFIVGIEYLGFRYLFGEEPACEASWARTREAMLRLALGMLGGEREWGNARQLASLLGIKLD